MTNRAGHFITAGVLAVASFCGLIAAPSAAASSSAVFDKPNFSGDWVFNPEKSKLEIKIKLESATFTIDHKEPDFRFSRVFVIGGKDNALAWALTTDGKEVVTVEDGRTDHSRLYWDGDVLVFDVRMVLKDGREATNVVRYSLRDGGRTFVAEEKFRGPVLKYDNLWVADRKNGPPA
jgi:hypothetical protein